MKHWNQQLQQMLPISSIKKVSIILLVLTCVFAQAGCTKQKTEGITLGEWIEEIIVQSGIVITEMEEPYFISITEESPYFLSVQSAVEWGIIDTEAGFEPEDMLNNEWTAYTLMNLIGKTQDENPDIRDINQTLFPSHVKAAVSSGLMKLDGRNMFYPKREIDETYAKELLSKAIDYINHKTFDSNSMNIDWDEETEVKEVTPIYFDELNKEAILPDELRINEGMIIYWQDEDGFAYTYRIIEMDGNKVLLEDVDLLDETDSMEFEGGSDIDFSNARILTDQQTVLFRPLQSGITNVSSRPLTKTFQTDAFNVKLTASATSLKAEVTKELQYGSKLYADVKINGLHVDYQWKSVENNVEASYFKVSFQSQEDLGLKNSSYKNLYGDFSKVDAEDFVSTLKNLYQSKNDVVEKTLTLATIEVPLPSAPSMTVSMNLDLTMYVTGRIQLNLTQKNNLGCEVRNSHMRLIKEMKNMQANDIKANAAVTAGIRFALKMASATLADIGVNAGAKATSTTTVHIYDEEGSHSQQQIDVPSDVADEMSDGHQNVLVCSDMNAHWVLNVKLNSSKSLLGKLGVSDSFNILNSETASMLPHGSQHMENFQFVPSCTRKERINGTSASDLTVNDKIKLKKVAIVIKEGSTKQIEVNGLPSGYAISDLRFTSENTDIAKVDHDGNVTGAAAGSTIVHVETSDGMYTIQCSILVSKVT